MGNDSWPLRTFAFSITGIIMTVEQQKIPSALKETLFSFPGQTAFYRGKVRDVYTINGKLLVMVATDRISAFDVVLPRPVPWKGQVLNQIAALMMQATTDIVHNWIISVPDPNVTIGRKCDPFRVEMVIRGYLAGHAWREYKSGKRILCGEVMPDGMKENDPFPVPLITPTTKANQGHDQDISRDEIIKRDLVTKDDYVQLEKYTRQLYTRGQAYAASKGLILVDTKYEFGKYGSQILLMDEIHTPDSSRYFYSDGYEQRQLEGKEQRQLSKEFVRQWLMENGFQGQAGQEVPRMTDEWLMTISARYVELYEQLSGKTFEPARGINPEERVKENILRSLESISL